MSLRARIFKNPRLFRLTMNLYPPYWGTGVRVVHVSKDFLQIIVEMRATRFNGNAFRTHFGGSLYSMTDPFYALMLVAQLGRDFVVWDKAAQIDFISPGIGTVTARFVLTQDQVAAVRTATAGGAKFEPVYRVDVLNSESKVVARVTKTLHVRKRPAQS